MKKAEVLEKSRQENKELDERQKAEQMKANVVASLVATVLTLFFMVISLFKGISVYPFLAIVFCNFAVLSFLNYRIKKSMTYKIQFIAWGMATIIYTIMFIWKG